MNSSKLNLAWDSKSGLRNANHQRPRVENTYRENKPKKIIPDWVLYLSAAMAIALTLYNLIF